MDEAGYYIYVIVCPNTQGILHVILKLNYILALIVMSVVSAAVTSASIAEISHLATYVM